MFDGCGSGGGGGGGRNGGCGGCLSLVRSGDELQCVTIIL